MGETQNWDYMATFRGLNNKNNTNHSTGGDIKGVTQQFGPDFFLSQRIK